MKEKSFTSDMSLVNDFSFIFITVKRSEIL